MQLLFLKLVAWIHPFSSWLWQVLLVWPQVLLWTRFPKPPLFHWRRHQAHPGDFHCLLQFDHHNSCYIPPFIIMNSRKTRANMMKITFQTHAIMRYIARKHDLCGKVLDMLWEDRYINRGEVLIPDSDGGRARKGGHACWAKYGL